MKNLLLNVIWEIYNFFLNHKKANNFNFNINQEYMCKLHNIHEYKQWLFLIAWFEHVQYHGIYMSQVPQYHVSALSADNFSPVVWKCSETDTPVLLTSPTLTQHLDSSR